MRASWLVVLFCVGSSRAVPADYMLQRSRFMSDDESRFVGANLTLTQEENIVDGQLKADKSLEYNVPELSFPPARHFFHAKGDIEKSAIFKFIQKMPKGAALHVHDLGAATVDFVVNNVTYRSDLWMRFDGKEMKFSKNAPGADWQLVSLMRAKAESRSQFDEKLRSLFAINVADPDGTYPDQDTVWDAFEKRFGVLFSILTYKPVFRDYYWQTLLDFYEDNVMFIELRVQLPAVYDLEGRQSSPIEVATMYRDVTDEFVQSHPGFFGARFIYAPSRHVQVDQFREYMHVLRQLKKALPDAFVGFDVVAREDTGRALIDFVPGLLQIRQEMPDIKFFFHAGETNWEDSTDMNLFDAVLLNATRIGHGYALVKHPVVMEEIKNRGIGIEMNPISNQVLNLVKDLRNHPGATLLADDFPAVVSSDDPGLWGSRGLSYDFYEAFMGLAGSHADLRLLKQLAINSLKYSSLSDSEKTSALEMFKRQWHAFIASELSSISGERDNSI